MEAHIKISSQLLDYQSAFHEQLRLVEQRKKNIIPDTFWLLQHHPVYTIGRSNSTNPETNDPISNLVWDKSLLKKNGIELLFTDRGGDITYHGPGQIIGYPIVNLEFRNHDLHKYLRDLEELIIRSLLFWDLKGERIEGWTGVWVNREKVCAMGIRVTKWITMHGFAFNVNPNLDHFQGIVPCGIGTAPVTSLTKLLNREVGMDEVIPVLIESAEQVFQWKFSEIIKE